MRDGRDTGAMVVCLVCMTASKLVCVCVFACVWGKLVCAYVAFSLSLSLSTYMASLVAVFDC